MASKLGTLIKEARTAADLTQEKLAKKVAGLTASDISLAERGEKELTQAQLRAIAKATGVTQASLLNAAKGTTKSSTKKVTAKKADEKKTAKSSSKKSAAAELKLTATERKLVEAYRAANSDQRKAALRLLQGEEDSLLGQIFSQDKDDSPLGGLLGNLADALLGDK